MNSTAAGHRLLAAGGMVAAFIVSNSLCAFANSLSDADTLAAQSKLYRVTLRGGSELIGVILNETADSLTVRTTTDITFGVSRQQVVNLEALSGTVNEGEYRRSDPNRSRLFFGPTARPVRGGYFADYELFFPFLSFGVADIFTFAGGMTLLPAAEQQLYYLAPKISFPLGSDNFTLAAGAVYTNITGEGNQGIGIAYGVTTVGSTDASLTLGMGMGFAEGEFAKNPVVLIGGEVRLSNSVALISENWIPTGSDFQLISFGFRFFGDHLSADIGFLDVLSDSNSDGFPFIPWLGFCYNFGGGN